MTLRNRLVLLYLCLTLCLMGSLVLFDLYSLGQIRNIHQEQLAKNQVLLSNSIDSIAQVHDLFAKDYSYWDGMAVAVESRDQEWLTTELSGPLEIYNIDAAFVLDTKLQPIYKVYKNGQPIEISDATFTTLPVNSENPVTVFSQMEGTSDVIRVKISAISPNSLPTTQVPSGYLVTAKIWDQSILKTMSESINAQVVVEPYIQQTNNNHVSILLPSITTSPLVMSAVFSSDYIDTLEASFYWQQMVLAGASVVFIVMTGLILHLWVTKPLKGVISTLAKCESLSIDPNDFTSSDEFTLLKRMVDDFIHQTKSIVKQNVKYEELTEALKTAMQELNRSREQLTSEFEKSLRLSRAVEVASDAVLMTNASGTIIYVNPAWEHLNQYSFSEVEGKNPRIIKSNKTSAQIYKQMWKSLADGEAFTTEEIVNRRRDGSEYNARVSINPIRENGKNMFYVGVVEDITERKTVDRLKTDFISLASHQLRTPLTSLRWMLELSISKDYSKSKLDDMLAEMQASTMKMISMVNGLLNISRLESGRMSIESQPVDTVTVLKKLLKEVNYLIDQKKIELSLELDKIEPIKLDQMLLREMLYNLLLNAVTYTPNSGRITVRVADLTNELLIEVKDTGIGIPLSEQNKIFEKFYRASNAIDIQSDGSGLGLYLVKLIVDAFNGSIGFSSTPGVGSTFSIKIPKKGVVTKTGEVTLTSQIGQLKASDKSVKSHH